jgi:AraC family carnitine catabolism transcriptional activator
MDRRVKGAISIMHQSVAAQLSMSTLSSRLNISSDRLRQLFKKEIGLSPTQYLRDLRMQRAARLLGSTFLSIKEITAACGIKDVSHFVRDFKKQHGSTPTVFRARSRESESGDLWKV